MAKQKHLYGSIESREKQITLNANTPEVFDKTI